MLFSITKWSSPAKKALQKMFMAGTSGAFFIALAQNIPAHVQQLYAWSRQPINRTYPADLGLRYVYLVWFLGYFFASSLRLENYNKDDDPPPEDLKFDIVQSVSSLVALYYLGFFSTGDVVISFPSRWAIFAANLAIAIICISALWYYRHELNDHKKLNVLRWWGFGISIVSTALTFLLDSIPPRWSWLVWLVWFALASILLWLLILFIDNRFKQANAKLASQTPPTAHETAPCEDENDPYTRWQGFRIAQLGICIALFLTFSVAALGFSANMLVQPTYAVTTGLATVSFFFSITFGLLSVLFGSVACLTRLADFRKTAQVVRHRTDTSMTAEVGQWRKDYKRLGRWTWGLFKSQLAAFALQVSLLMLTLGITYWLRLT